MKPLLCSDCRVEKTDENTHRFLTGKKIGTFQGYCNACSCKASKRRRDEHPEKRIRESRQRKEEFRTKINFIKLERPCYDCGGTFVPEAMDFDHVSGIKEFDVTHGWNYSWDSVREEIDKCQLVCAICHRIRTQRRRILR